VVLGLEIASLGLRAIYTTYIRLRSVIHCQYSIYSARYVCYSLSTRNEYRNALVINNKISFEPASLFAERLMWLVDK